MKTYESKYRQIKTVILQRISDGTYLEGQKIGSESELGAEFQASRTTVRRALDDMVSQGILYRVHGVGTFVDRFPESAPTKNQTDIVLVLPYFSEGYTSGMFPDLIEGVGDATGKAGLSFVTVMEPRTEDETKGFLDQLVQLNPRGILYSTYLSESIQPHLIQLGIPVVYIDANPANCVFDTVCGEDYDSAYRAVQWMYSQGCRRIGYFSYMALDFSTNYKRYHGTISACRDLELPVRESRFRASKQNESGMDLNAAALEFLAENEDMDGLVVLNDTVAAAVLYAASHLHRRLPDTLQIISYGHYRNVSRENVHSYEQHFCRYGREGVELLLERIENGLQMPRQTRLIRYDLI